MATVRGGRVLPHVQAFADAVQEETGAASFGTYPGHDPSLERALDIFVAPASYSSDPTLGNQVAQLTVNRLEEFGISYLIWRQRIFNPRIVSRWRDMPSRGDPVQDHYDHVHVSFDEDAPGINEEDFDMATSEEVLQVLKDSLGKQRNIEDILKWQYEQGQVIVQQNNLIIAALGAENTISEERLKPLEDKAEELRALRENIIFPE